MLISCLLPTFGRYPHLAYLVEEAVESFLRQDYTNKELILLNDTPNQSLSFNHPQVRVINTNFRYPTLGEKLHWMLEQAQGDYICRWDDDDISLPWRLSLSRTQLAWNQFKGTKPDGPIPPQMEWRPENHWYDPKAGDLKITEHPGNTHIMGIWHRDVILGNGLKYPGMPCPSGAEDQTFNKHLWSLGYPRYGDLLQPEQVFYLYRWGHQPHHLSGKGGGDRMQQAYDELYTHERSFPGNFTIHPRWHQDHIARVKEAIAWQLDWNNKQKEFNNAHVG